MSLRDEMPKTAAFIDALRAEFGKEGIDANIRKGMQGLPGFFYASEAGQEVGTRALPARTEISGTDMMIGPFNPVSQPAAKRSNF